MGSIDVLMFDGDDPERWVEWIDALIAAHNFIVFKTRQWKGKEDTKKSEEEKTFESDDREHVESDDNDGGDDLILYSNRLILYVKSDMLILDYPVMVQEKDDPEPETPLLEEDNSSKTEMDIDSCQVYEKILKRKNKVTKKKKKSSVEKHDFEASDDDGAKRDTGKRKHVDDYDLGNTSHKPKEKSKEKIQREDLVTAVKKLDIMAMDPKEEGWGKLGKGVTCCMNLHGQAR
ncbi:Uncharacterized protein Rs2_02481 [Raphanus sativus]|nr:Uncharacterized protein Rs2_02481 [Raphanus sativus]